MDQLKMSLMIHTVCYKRKCWCVSNKMSVMWWVVMQIVLLFETPWHWHILKKWVSKILSGAISTVSVKSGPNIFCSVLAEQGADGSLKVTTLSKQLFINNKINLSSVNWKFKRRSGTSFNLSQWIEFKTCPLSVKLLLKQIKTVQKLFQILP